MSTHTIGLLLAILGGFVPSVRTTLPAQTFTSTLLGQNLLYCKRLNIGLHEPEVRRHIPDFLKKSGM